MENKCAKKEKWWERKWNATAPIQLNIPELQVHNSGFPQGIMKPVGRQQTPPEIDTHCMNALCCSWAVEALGKKSTRHIHAFQARPEGSTPEVKAMVTPWKGKPPVWFHFPQGEAPSPLGLVVCDTQNRPWPWKEALVSLAKLPLLRGGGTIWEVTCGQRYWLTSLLPYAVGIQTSHSR